MFFSVFSSDLKNHPKYDSWVTSDVHCLHAWWCHAGCRLNARQGVYLWLEDGLYPIECLQCSQVICAVCAIPACADCKGKIGVVSLKINQAINRYIYKAPIQQSMLIAQYGRLWKKGWDLKTLDTIGNCQRPIFSFGVSQHMHKIRILWKLELKRSPKLWDINEIKKHPCHTKLCALRWLISRAQIQNVLSWNQFCVKILFFSKTTLLQREPFLTMFYTINLSP